MSTFWWIIIGAVILALVAFARSKKRAVIAFSAVDEAGPWFASRGIDPKSVMFSSYQDAQLTKVAGATIVVGYGRTRQGADVGFAIEIFPGRGVVASELLNPSGIATHHKSASMRARASGQPLLSVLSSMAAAHRARHAPEPLSADDAVDKVMAEARERFTRMRRPASNVPATPFMAAMPHPDTDKPLRTLAFEREHVVIDYYENPQSIGKVTTGIEQPFERPQVAVIRERNQPALIVQTEESIPGTLLLCALDPTGRHINHGPFEPDPRLPPAEGFIAEAIQVFRQTKG